MGPDLGLAALVSSTPTDLCAPVRQRSRSYSLVPVVVGPEFVTRPPTVATMASVLFLSQGMEAGLTAATIAAHHFCRLDARIPSLNGLGVLFESNMATMEALTDFASPSSWRRSQAASKPCTDDARIKVRAQYYRFRPGSRRRGHMVLGLILAHH